MTIAYFSIIVACLLPIVCAGLAKSKGIRMGGGRYDEGHRCVGWRDRSNGEFECRPY